MITHFGDIGFFVYLTVAMIPAVWLGLTQRRIAPYGLAVSILTIVVMLADSKRQLAFLGMFFAGEAALAWAHLRFLQAKGRGHKVERRLVIALGLLPLALTKLSGLVEFPSLGFIGISYLTFRAIQVLLEMSDGLITEFRLTAYAYLLLFFPTLSAGPIDRSRRFDQDADNPPPRDVYLRLLGQGVWWMVLGAGYKFGLGSLFEYALADGRTLSRNLVTYMYGYGFQLFFDFGGYSLMAVGASRVFGIRTPLNFRYPFVAESIKDFWNRWHITLSFWLRDYVFSRLTMALIKRKVFKNRSTTAQVGFLVNMTVMGVWHGTQTQYILYGLYHGVLMVLTDLYETRLPFYKRFKSAMWYRLLSIVVTFHLVMFGFLIFSGRLTSA